MEIGSVLEINPLDLFKKHEEGCGLYPFEGKAIWYFSYFNTGRASIEALLCFLKEQGYKRVWLPGYNCSSVYDAASRSGVEIKLYDVGRELLINRRVFDQLQENDILYFIQYFGQEEEPDTYEAIRNAQKKGIIIVEDLSLALLSEGESIGVGDYVIGSVRKWLPMPDGGFVASRKQLPLFTKSNAANNYTLYYFAAQIMKTQYLQDTGLDKQMYLDLTNKGMTDLFSDYTIREISELSKNVIGSTNLKEIALVRKRNYDYLYDNLCGIKELKLMVKPSPNKVALGMLICVDDRDALFRYLVKNGIYCNIHWKENEATLQFEDTVYLSHHCLTLPCDQRYSAKHMDFICRTIKDYYYV